VKETGRRDARIHARGLLSFRADIHRTGDIGADIREGAIPLAELEVFRGVDGELIEAKCRKLTGDEDQLIGVRVRQRLEEYAIHDAEDRRVGTDA
jgi:hypothetical protein